MTTTESVQQNRQRGEGRTRQERAKWLFRNGAFERLSAYVWIAENPKRKTDHRVDLAAGTCDCVDHRRNSRKVSGFMCYHRIAVELHVSWLRRTARALAPYFDEEAA